MGTSCLIQSLDQLLFCPFHPSFLKPWLEGSMAGVCESLLCTESVHGQSHQSSSKGHWPQVNDSSDRYCLGFLGFPPPLQFCSPHLAPFQGAWEQCHCPWVTIGTARLRRGMAEDQAVADSTTKQEKEFSKATQTWQPQIYIQTFPPFSFSEFGTFASERETGKRWI